MPYSLSRESNYSPVNLVESTKNSARLLSASLFSSVQKLYSSSEREPINEVLTNNGLGLSNSISEITTLSFTERIALFFLCVSIGAIFLLISLWLLPMIMLVPAKFAFFFTFGNIFCLTSVGFLVGWKFFIIHLFDKNRKFASVFIVMSFTLTFLSLFRWRLKSLALMSCAIQLMSVVWFVLSYIPYARQVFWLASTFINTSFL